MKIAINRCYGGFSLSPKAVKMHSELEGKKCFFFKYNHETKMHIPISENDIDDNYMSWCAFTIENPDKYLGKSVFGIDGTFKEYNAKYREISLSNRDIPRDDLNLIKVIETLKEEANGHCAELAIIEIPDNVDWEVAEYDGMETVEEKHRRWY